MRIVLADDHPLFRGGVRNLIQTTDDLEVIGEAATGEEAVEMASSHQPDVIVMDIRMPGLNGIEATQIIKEKFPKIKILIVTMLKNDKSVFTAMKMGASGYVLKDAGEMELLHSIRMVGNGSAVFSADIAARMMQYFSKTEEIESVNPVLSDLTAREKEILELIVEEKTNAQIAARLHLSVKTVANHVTNILNKLQASDRHEAKKIFKTSQSWEESEMES
ncbi:MULTISPECIES: response regulator transcription factor [Neobacillus]|uniref:Response regulator transcription factor n=1 Tax=Neobacillus rhizophilus TaxID=2833579 RepID=A0A942YSL3_9BACI|nr:MULTISPECIES: response regulator transcription factor [Neobacillus]MBS4211259.1 response regulator transcription factor [Neobacillus rhizophilus]MBU8918782.1 response regulator transcription factor [Bacillus sp. FJAT-29953]